ncbi:hypothetical protein P8452_06371 [Trifolium repens]|nr:hypothetical protein P8452_06371 [Trifolium repens]
MFLLGSVKSNVTQQRLNLLTNKFIFSAFGTSLKGTKGSIPETMLAGNTADDEARFKEAPPPFDRCWLLPAARGDSLERDSSSESVFDDFLGSLLKICFSIATQKLKFTNSKAFTSNP